MANYYFMLAFVNFILFGINVLNHNELLSAINLLAIGACFTVYLQMRDSKDE